MAARKKPQAPLQAAPIQADAAPWPFPKAADIEASQASQAAFFASRSLAIIAESEASGDAAPADHEDSEAISDAEIARQQSEAEKAFDAAIEASMGEADKAAPASGIKKPYIHSSSIPRPTKKVWAIADAMIRHAEQNDLPIPSRGEIIAECIKRGIASGTSATQYQYWKKANGR
jgi:hypothetical protein